MRTVYTLIPTRFAESFVRQPTHYSICATYHFQPGSIQHDVYGPVRYAEVEHDLPTTEARAKILELIARG